MPTPTATGVGYEVDATGYTVTTWGLGGATLDEYRAGNHPGESTIELDPADPYALDLDTLHRFARQTAIETAEAHGLTEADVTDWTDQSATIAPQDRKERA